MTTDPSAKAAGPEKPKSQPVPQQDGPTRANVPKPRAPRRSHAEAVERHLADLQQRLSNREQEIERNRKELADAQERERALQKQILPLSNAQAARTWTSFWLGLLISIVTVAMIIGGALIRGCFAIERLFTTGATSIRFFPY
ncbi:MAG: hypothetical protein HYX68_29545 [Planctomycetes bacterium]|nr:hypothetical protein [Planctomycetota bacterium]